MLRRLAGVRVTPSPPLGYQRRKAARYVLDPILDLVNRRVRVCQSKIVLQFSRRAKNVKLGEGCLRDIPKRSAKRLVGLGVTCAFV